MRKDAVMGTRVTYNWHDPLMLDDLLTEEERLIRDNAHNFAQEHLAPRVTPDFRHERANKEIILKLGQAGLLEPTINGFNCAGVNETSYGLIAREIERVNSGYRSAFSVQSSLVMFPIHQFGSSTQKKYFYPS